MIRARVKFPTAQFRVALSNQLFDHTHRFAPIAFGCQDRRDRFFRDGIRGLRLQFSQVIFSLRSGHSVYQIDSFDRGPSDDGSVRLSKDCTQTECGQLGCDDRNQTNRAGYKKLSELVAPFQSISKMRDCSREINRWHERDISESNVSGHDVGIKTQAESSKAVSGEIF